MSTQILRDPDPFYLDEPLLPVVTAAGGPMAPPAAWFQPPEMLRPTAIQVLPSGQIYGHIAAWNTLHTGMAGGIRPPRSASKYAYFRTGVVRTAEGTDQPVGQITLAGGHAPLTSDAAGAVQHYDDTNTAVADVNVGEDRHGIWVAGAVRPDVSDGAIRALRASAPSGDWRPINGRHELIAVCQVNSPGFPVPRAECLVASGQPQAIVAAGAMDMYARRMLDVFIPDEALTAAIDARIEHRVAKEIARAEFVEASTGKGALPLG
jgi:hypothetical protein